jgi:hypothetical protein
VGCDAGSRGWHRRIPLIGQIFSAKKKTIKNLLKRYGIMADPILAPWNGEYPKMSQEFVSIIK